jgi:hypothetical protein
MKKVHTPASSFVKTSHQKIEDPQNDKKKIENFGTSKYQNKRPLKFPKERKIPYFLPCETSPKNLKTPKMTRRKSKILKHQNTKTKNFQKFTRRKENTPLPPL